MHNELLQVRTPYVNFYVLKDEKKLYLIDCGFVGGQKYLKKSLHLKGWGNLKVAGIIITHGHLDHILNVFDIAKSNDAWIYAPEFDKERFKGKVKYSGISYITGVAESVGRTFLRYKPFSPDRYLSHGDIIKVWHGLEVISLPGHTRGHIGLYCKKLKILFSADLFASFETFSHAPPCIFNEDNMEVRKSMRKALNLDLTGGVLPNHGDEASPEVNRERLEVLAKKLGV